MSLFPNAGSSSYQVGDLKITSPTPSIFASNLAAVPGVSTEGNFPMQKRPVVNHHFTGVDVPLLYPSELQARLGADYPDPEQPGVDEYGVPNALSERRRELLDAAARVNLDKSEKVAQLGKPSRCGPNASHSPAIASQRVSRRNAPVTSNFL